MKANESQKQMGVILTHLKQGELCPPSTETHDDIGMILFTPPVVPDKHPRMLTDLRSNGPEYPVCIIGLNGSLGSGRQTLVREIDRAVGSHYRVHHFRFMDPVINAASELFDIPHANFHCSKLSDTEFYDSSGEGYRMENTGTPAKPSDVVSWLNREVVIQHLGKTHLVRLMQNKLNRILQSGRTCVTVIVVSDVKTLDEALLLHDMGAYLFRIDRPETNKNSKEEVILDALIDETLKNNGTKKQLYYEFKKKIMEHVPNIYFP